LSQRKGEGIAHVYGMTPEERFTTIENLLASVTEAQVRNEAQIEANNAAIEKQNAGIRDLVIVSRTLVEAQTKMTDAQTKATEAQMQTTAQIEAVSAELRETQKATEDKLHALIEIVDRMIRNQQK
jgi:hypothetical protein